MIDDNLSCISHFQTLVDNFSCIGHMVLDLKGSCYMFPASNDYFRYGTGTLTDVFLDRVFQECLTYEGEMVSWFSIILIVI